MCQKTESKADGATTSKAEMSLKSKAEIAISPTHSASHRSTEYDWIAFLVPALFYKVTPVGPLYVIAIIRIIVAKAILSFHYMLVDKDNYHNKLSRKQLEREGGDFLTGFYLHMWIQVALQIIFPAMFFADDSELSACLQETFWSHVFLVEPLYYFVHRWLHIPQYMKAMHGFHHSSINTTPTTATVQNFLEHFVYVATFGPAFFLPWLLHGRQHYVAIGAYLVLFDIINCWGHTNVRIRHWLFNSKYSPLTYMFYTPEFHLGHHAYFQANYGLFMPIWDRMLGTYREYKKREPPLLPKKQQDFVFIGHNGGLGHLFTCPEFNFYSIYEEYKPTGLPLKLEFFIMHMIAQVHRLIVGNFYFCPRFCVANEYIARVISLVRTPWDYTNPKSYKGINDEVLECMRQQHRKHGTRYFGLGNLNKMKQLNDGGREIARMVAEDSYLGDKNVRVWTGDTMTVASIYNQIVDIPDLKEFFYVGAGGKIGTAVCGLIARNMPHIKIRIFSKNHHLNFPNVSYSTDLSEITNYQIVLVGKLLSESMYRDAFRGQTDVQTRYVLDYTVPALPVATFQKREINHIRIGLLKTRPGNPFLKGHYDICMGHDQNHIVPCHFGCLLNTINHRESNEVGDINLDNVQKMWQMTLARGFSNVEISFDDK